MFSRRFNHMFMWVGILIVGVYVLYEIATEFKAKGVDKGWALENAGMFPRILGVFIIASAVVGMGLIIYEKVIHEKQEDTCTGDVVPFDGYCWGVLVLLLVYVFTLGLLGYYVGSILFMSLCLVLLRSTNVHLKSLLFLGWTSLVISVPIVFIFGWIFESLLGFVLPLGIWELTLS